MEKPIVFLSHSSKDAKVMQRLKECLEAKTHGTIQFFLSCDGESIPFGRNWVATIQDALEHASLAFVFISPHSAMSSWVNFETGYMYAKKIRVVPVAILGIDLGKIPPPINLLQGFNIHSVESLNNIFRIINDEFKTSHNDILLESDFKHIFQTQADIEAHFFGEYGQLIETFRLSANVVDSVKKEFIEIVKAKNLDVGNALGGGVSTFGLVLTEQWNRQGNNPPQINSTLIDISPDLSKLSLEIIDELLPKMKLKAPVSIYITFSTSVLLLSSASKISSKLYGAEVSILENGNYRFKETAFKFRNQPYSVADYSGPGAIAHLQASIQGALGTSGIDDLVKLLFERGVLSESSTMYE